MWNSNRPWSAVRVYLRIIYAVFVWHYQFNWLDIPIDGLAPLWSRKLATYVAAAVVLFVGVLENRCGKGTKMEVHQWELFFIVHLVVFSAVADAKYVHIANNAVLALCTIYAYVLYAHFAINDMSNLTLHGAWKVGLKRSRAQHGNQLLVFYPVSRSTKTQSVQAYRRPHKTVEAKRKVGMASWYQVNDHKNRTVAKLCPDASLADEFRRGEKQLIPAVFCHGNMASSEEHFAVCMQLASHGYMIISLDFMDGTCPYTTNKNGRDLFFSGLKANRKTKDGKPN